MAMSNKGTAGLFFLATAMIMNSTKYLEMLKYKLELHLAVHGCDTFMQDSDLCSKIVSTFQKKKKVKSLDWPSDNSNLSPNENLWTLLKDKC